ncbi:MAG: hypothetical protein OXI53_02385 [Nitrospira sp.]|nr:hypothetical protein [Nitrospira sp.]MDE0404138.1 hypothetical protein [Nitrospira sp.]MDE0487347.1 hypothetical protein [Nitrospira sp.]
MPTARNARGIDIIAYNKSNTRFIGVQVKSLSKRNPVPLGNSIEKVMGDFWIIVNNVAKEPNVFVMFPKEVRSLAHRGERNGKISYWLQPTAYDAPQFREAWHRIGRGDEQMSDVDLVSKA